jgi:hypothetical protein
VLTLAVTAQLLLAIARWHAQVLQVVGRVNHQQLAVGKALNLWRQL